MLKIKVNFDKKSYQTLINDMKLFKITKSDGTPNKNKLLITNLFKDKIYNLFKSYIANKKVLNQIICVD